MTSGELRERIRAIPRRSMPSAASLTLKHRSSARTFGIINVLMNSKHLKIRRECARARLHVAPNRDSYLIPPRSPEEHHLPFLICVSFLPVDSSAPREGKPRADKQVFPFFTVPRNRKLECANVVRARTLSGERKFPSGNRRAFDQSSGCIFWRNRENNPGYRSLHGRCR